MGFDVVVVGSVNQDLTICVPTQPRPGETVLGTGHTWGGGGKGANQAVAAARLGSRTAFIGRVGHDEAGRSLAGGLATEGVDVSCLEFDPTAPSGLAVITLDEDAENSIVVSPGANMQLSPGHVAGCSTILESATVTLAQLEIPVDAVVEAARICRSRFCLNPAPARAVPRQLLERVDVLIPNRGELAALVGAEELAGDELVDAARQLEGPGAVVVTLGSEGALVVEPDRVTTILPASIEPVDTTGAGDAFCGALANALSRGTSLVDAARWAALAGGIAATRHGAQAAMPTRAEMEMQQL